MQLGRIAVVQRIIRIIIKGAKLLTFLGVYREGGKFVFSNSKITTSIHDCL